MIHFCFSLFLPPRHRDIHNYEVYILKDGAHALYEEKILLYLWYYFMPKGGIENIRHLFIIFVGLVCVLSRYLAYRLGFVLLLRANLVGDDN